MRYHRPHVDSIANFLSPPYDVISPGQYEDFYNRNEYNIIRIDIPRETGEDDKYRKAAELLEDWERKGILVVESKPAVYVTEDYYLDWEGYRRIRRGFIAILKVEDFDKGSIFPHEKTFRQHKEDRFRLQDATHAQFNPVFSFYSDADGKIAPILKSVVDRSLPDWNFRFDDGATRTMWTLTDQAAISKIVDAMKSREIFIADGHHRYETALEYSRMMDEKPGGSKKDMPHQYVMMYFVNVEDEGLSILAAHRMFRNLPGFSEKLALEKLGDNFRIEKVNRSQAMDKLNAHAEAPAMVAQIGTKFFWLEAKREKLETNEDLRKLHESLRYLNVSACSHLIYKPLIGDADDILEHISFEIDPVKVNEGVESGQYDMAIYLAPVTIEQLEKAARARQVMPQKSTYFYPKLLTGLAIYRFSGNNC